MCIRDSILVVYILVSCLHGYMVNIYYINISDLETTNLKCIIVKLYEVMRDVGIRLKLPRDGHVSKFRKMATRYTKANIKYENMNIKYENMLN